MPFKSILTSAVAAVLLATPALAEIEIHHAYARASNTMAGAAFMVLHNTSDTGDRLVSVASDAAARVELHTHTEDENGVMRMVHVTEGFDLPAGGALVLERGGAHVMFMGLTAPFEQGAPVTVTFIFENAGDITIDIPVDQNRTETVHDSMDHSETDHGTMDHSDMDHGSDG